MHSFTPLAIFTVVASVTAYSDLSEFDIRDLEFDQADQELIIRNPRFLSTGLRGIRPSILDSNLRGSDFSVIGSAADGSLPLTQRDLDRVELYARVARGVGGGRAGGVGGGRKTPNWGNRIETGSNVVGSTGAALSGIADFGNMIQGKAPPKKRDLSSLSDDDLIEIHTRSARAGRGGGPAAGAGGSSNKSNWGNRIETGSNVVGSTGAALSGIADFGNMIRGSTPPKKRDLERLFEDDVELFVREEFENIDY